MKGFKNLDTAVLVRLAQDGDKSALAYLCQREYEALLQYAGSCARSVNLEPRDLLSMAWEKIIPALPSLQNPAAFRGWATTIIQRLAIREASKYPSTDEFDESVVSSSEVMIRASVLEDQALSSVNAQALLRWMADNADTETISIVAFRAFDGLSWREVGRQMDRFYPSSAPWTKSKCEKRIKKISNRGAAQLRRLAGGN